MDKKLKEIFAEYDKYLAQKIVNKLNNSLKIWENISKSEVEVGPYTKALVDITHHYIKTGEIIIPKVEK